MQNSRIENWKIWKLAQCNIYNIRYTYSDNQKTMEKRQNYSNNYAFWCCYKANIFTSNSAKHNLKWKGSIYSVQLCYAGTRSVEGVYEISLFCGEELFSPVLYRCSELGTLEWINFNPDFLIRISTVETFNFCPNPLVFSLLGYPLIVFSNENISVLSLVARFSLIGCYSFSDD